MTFNKRLLSVEDANSIIEHFGKAVTDYYTLDTRILVSQTWFAYDFIEIYRSTDIIQFTIQNSLWTGGYYIKECNISNYEVTTNGNILNVTGTGLNYVVLVLELSSEYEFDDRFELSFNPKYTPFIKPFYEDLTLDIDFVNKNNQPVSNLEIYDSPNQKYVYTDSSGHISITAPHTRPGDVDYLFDVLSDQILTYYMPFIALKADLPVIMMPNDIYKDKINRVVFKFLYDKKYDFTDNLLFNDNDISLVVNGKTYSLNSYHNGAFDFYIDLSGYFSDTVEMKLIVEGNVYLNKSTFNFVKNVDYFTTDDTTLLKSEIENENGADTIIFTGNHLEVPIYVNRDVTIEFTDITNNSSESAIPFIVDEGSVLTLKNLVYTSDNGKNFVLVNNGDLVCLNCKFQDCFNTVIVSKKGDVTIENCIFENNYSCINVKDNLSLYNTTFNLDNVNLVDTNTVAFIAVLNNLTMDYCKFNIELSGLSNLGLSYLFFKIGKSCIVNNVKANNLLVNQSFPVKYNTSSVNVESERFIIQNSTNKCMIWTIEDTNTVYSNDMVVKYV